ncbi:MAG TPA: formate dehydrogenase accessory protein FdhE [Steroidobacteraceae bacterium]|jgi:FdhE protein|nr:formate dehydrogenase accessory protein FdhE [Steroidobacteraceae bacterium]
MQRVLDPAQIEAFAQRALPRLRLPDSSNLYARRAQRLRQLAAASALGDYLQLMAALCDAQQVALDGLGSVATAELEAAAERTTLAQRHGLPPLTADGWPRHARWRSILTGLCRAIGPLPGFPAPVAEVCSRLTDERAAQPERQADLLLAGQTAGIETAAAPFIMAALQVYWVDLGRHLSGTPAPPAVGAMAVVCPLCRTRPVASVVHADKHYDGYRYLHCALCATGWHLVRVKCSQCQTTAGIRYHFVENASDAVRAESCDSCHTYRKILYHEKDPAAEPVADDLATLTLDLLMAADGFHRGSGNPLLWQPGA